MKHFALLILLALSSQLSMAQPGDIKLDSIIIQNLPKNFEGVIQISRGPHRRYIYPGNGVIGESLANKRFPIASITKLFTSIIIFQLIEEDMISLETSYSKKDFDFIPSSYGEVSVSELLLHTSPFPKEPDSIFFEILEPEDFIKKVLEKSSGNDQEGFLYKNIDYILLGLIIEDVTGNSFSEELNHRILKPLGMSDTGLITNNTMYEKFSTYKDPDNILNFQSILGETFFIQNYFSAGAMFSTAADLELLDDALRANKLLSRETKEKMFTSHPQYNYSAYGVWVYNYPFVDSYPRIMERRGSILGYNSVFLRFLDLDLSIIILSNSTSFHPNSFGDTTNIKEVLIHALSD